MWRTRRMRTTRNRRRLCRRCHRHHRRCRLRLRHHRRRTMWRTMWIWRRMRTTRRRRRRCHRHHRRCRLRLRHHRRRRLRSSLAAFVLNPMISTARWSSSHSAADASRGFTTGACRHGTRKPGNQSLPSLGLTLHGGGRTRSLRVPVVGPLLKWGARPPPPARARPRVCE